MRQGYQSARENVLTFLGYNPSNGVGIAVCLSEESMRRGICCVFLLVATIAAAQVQEQQQVQRRAPRAVDSAAAKAKPTPAELERGRRMLETAEAAASGMEGGVRAYALLQIARVYQISDKKKAVTLLNDALSATRGMDDDRRNTRQYLEEQILQTLVPLAPQRADELLDQVDPASRGKVVIALLDYYQKNKDLDRAIEVIYRLAPQGDVPYDAVGRILDVLPSEREADRQQLFALALTNFRDHPEARRSVRYGNGDFPSLILSQWKHLPKEMVLTAIDEALTQAKNSGQTNGSAPRNLTVAMTTPSGAVAFNSMYEFRLFQLLPVLRQLDEAEADKLLKQYQDVQTLLGKYPQGTQSLTPASGAGEDSSANVSMSISSNDGTAPPPGSPAPRSPVVMQQAQKIMEDATKHPQDALANAAALPDTRLRAETYMGIAHANAKKNSSATKQALEKLMDLVPELDLTQQMMVTSSAAKLYLELDETASARRVVEKGMSIADKIYKQDTNSDDPNKALKAYWPSAEAYRSFLRVAARISPAWALQLTNEITDQDMKGLVQIALAQTWLDVPEGSRTIMRTTKSGNMTMTSDN